MALQVHRVAAAGDVPGQASPEAGPEEATAAGTEQAPAEPTWATEPLYRCEGAHAQTLCVRARVSARACMRAFWCWGQVLTDMSHVPWAPYVPPCVPVLSWWRQAPLAPLSIRRMGREVQVWGWLAPAAPGARGAVRVLASMRAWGWMMSWRRWRRPRLDARACLCIYVAPRHICYHVSGPTVRPAVACAL
jgi:hypothetical protein